LVDGQKRNLPAGRRNERNWSVFMKITRKNAVRLASITALGAGALGVAAGTAEAGTIVEGPYPLNNSVGFPTPESGSGTFAIGNVTVGNLFNIRWYRTSSSRFSDWKIAAQTGTTSLRFAANLATKALSNWAGPVSFSRLIASRFVQRGSVVTGYGPSTTGAGTSENPGSLEPHFGSAITNVGGTDKTVGGTLDYLLFHFLNPVNSHTDFGWLQLSNVTISTGDPAGPTAQLVDWGYYDTSNVPEPSTLLTGGLVALALGAAGLRRWRAARKPTS
jgi:hypothetical protein